MGPDLPSIGLMWMHTRWYVSTLALALSLSLTLTHTVDVDALYVGCSSGLFGTENNPCYSIVIVFSPPLPTTVPSITTITNPGFWTQL
jgi:hypothetical protein